MQRFWRHAGFAAAAPLMTMLPPCSLSDGTNTSEPNDIVRSPERCGLANFSMASGNETHTAWGWADDNCNQKYTYMCKISSE